MDYPKMEVIMSVPTADDPAIPVVKKLIGQYPKVDAKLLVGEGSVGINPKINNLIKGYNGAKYDILWMYDSNIYMEPHTLDSAVHLLQQPNIGLVHHLPRGIHFSDFGGLLESMYLDSSHARIYLVCNFLCSLFQKSGVPMSCVTGKSLMIRKSILDRAGGLMSLGSYLAEDNMIGTKIAELGYRHCLADDFASQLLGKFSLADFIGRRVRWARLRLFLLPGTTTAEPFTECFAAGLLGALAAKFLFGFHSGSFLLFHVLLWFICDFFLYSILSNPLKPDQSSFLSRFSRFASFWIIRESTVMLLFLYGISGNTVEWRNVKYVLRWGGTAVPLGKHHRNCLSIAGMISLVNKFISGLFVDSPAPIKQPIEWENRNLRRNFKKF